jgi:hypothetical protein
VRSVEESNAILEMLMGKPDSTTMREKLEYAQNEENVVDKRIEALDDFEMVRLFLLTLLLGSRVGSGELLMGR